MPTVSYGVLLIDEEHEILLAHSTGNRHWDIPKGQGEPDELPLVAALRELKEETGIELSPEALVDLGPQAYRADKVLHLFLARVVKRDIDPRSCICTSFFTHPLSGKALPEMDDFQWAPFSKVPELCAKNMARVLTKLLPTL